MKIPKPAIKKARIEIIPMIDAIFFLLVFFMFSSLSMIKLRGADVSLPTKQASAATAAAGGSGGDGRLVVSVTPQNGFFLNKNQTSRLNLKRDLQKFVDAHPNAVLVLNLAPTQNAQTLIDVMDAARDLKTRKGQAPPILIATEPVDAEGNPLKSSAVKAKP